MEHTTKEEEKSGIRHGKVNNNFLAIITGAVIIAAAIIYSFSGNSKVSNEEFVDPDSMFSGRELKQEEFLVGNKERKVILVEYSDLECPFCKKFHTETMNNIYDKYKNSIGIAYRHFPLSIHKKAGKEAEATLCARSLGGNEVYKKYISKVFEVTEGNDSLDHTQLPVFAADLGLDAKKFTECLNSGTFAAQVEADLNDGLEVGVQGTPNTFVLVKDSNKEYQILTVINGARDEKYVSRVIDQALKMTK